MPDQTYQKSVPGTKTAAVISRLIHIEEMEALSTFIKSQLATVANKPINLITFEHTDDGSAPDECAVVMQGEEPPEGAKKEWSGTMIMTGQTQSVTLYRLAE